MEMSKCSRDPEKLIKVSPLFLTYTGELPSTPPIHLD